MSRPRPASSGSTSMARSQGAPAIATGDHAYSCPPAARRAAIAALKDARRRAVPDSWSQRSALRCEDALTLTRSAAMTIRHSLNSRALILVQSIRRKVDLKSGAPVHIVTPLVSRTAMLPQLISLYAQAVRSGLRQRVTSLESPFDQVSNTPE
jgi:hypothetical protein